MPAKKKTPEKPQKQKQQTQQTRQEPKTLSLEALSRATLARQMLLAREKMSPQKALDRLLAIQAQWAKPPFIAFWSRLSSFERSDLSSLATKSVVVRGTIFRGTIFLMNAKDFAQFRMTTQVTLERGVTSIAKAIPESDHDAIVKIGRAYFKTPHTFDGLRDELSAKAKEKKLQKTAPEEVRRMAYLVRMRVPLLQVATDEQAWGWHAQCDFTLAESLIKDAPLSLKDEKDALVLRYLGALGPATVADAQNFLGLTGLKEVFERLRPKLVTFLDDKKKELFDLPNAPRPDPDDSKAVPPVRFLPEFDNPVMGYADRRRFIDDRIKPFVFLPGLVVARTYITSTGRVSGTWAIDVAKNKKRDATLVISPFGAVDKKTKAAIEEEGEALLRFYEPESGSRALRFEKPR